MIDARWLGRGSCSIVTLMLAVAALAARLLPGDDAFEGTDYRGRPGNGGYIPVRGRG